MNLGDIQLIELVTPAIAISVLAYLINFFGKIIADQKPFADNRDWEIQLSGSYFILNIILSGVAGVYLANTVPLLVGHWTLHLMTFFILSLMGGCLWFYTTELGNSVYNIRKKAYEKFDAMMFNLPSSYAPYGKYISPSILSLVAFYLCTLELQSGNLYWIVISFSLTLNIYIWSALSFSLKRIEKIAPTLIHFKNQDVDPVEVDRILKINDDNIRARVGDAVVIINKDEVLKVEMKVLDE